MSNLAYLCSSDFDRIYPSFGNPDYDVRDHTVACCVDGVPLLWIALFRPSDLREADFEVKGPDARTETLHAWAPFALKEKAIDQLKEAIPVLHCVFQGWGTLDEHAELLEEALRDAEGSFVTVQLDEAEALHEEGEFRRRFEHVLRHLAAPSESDAEARGDFIELACLEREGGFPPADAFLEDTELREEEDWNLAHLLGTGHFRPVPWE